MKRPAESALGDLALLQREINELFDSLGVLERRDAGWQPGADVYQCGRDVVVVVEVPGLGPESIEVSYHDGQVTVSGQRRDRRPGGKRGSFLCVERPQGRFTRVLPLEVPVDARRARARLSGGLLTITLPRLDDRRGRAVAIPVRREET